MEEDNDVTENTVLPKLILESKGMKLNGKQYEKLITFLEKFREDLSYTSEFIITGFYINYTE
jgi:hypothetical protein